MSTKKGIQSGSTPTKKIKDLPPNTNLGGIKVRTTSGKVGYWASQWPKGVWLAQNPERMGKVEPVFVEDIKECMEWEVLE